MRRDTQAALSAWIVYASLVVLAVTIGRDSLSSLWKLSLALSAVVALPVSFLVAQATRKRKE